MWGGGGGGVWGGGTSDLVCEKESVCVSAYFVCVCVCVCVYLRE